MESSEFDELKNTVETLIIENALNVAQIKTLTSDLFELMATVLTAEQNNQARRFHYNTLLDYSSAILKQTDQVVQPQKSIRALFELSSSVQNQLKDLSGS